MRARSLLENALSSVVASGTLIFSTLLIPAILMRTIDRHDYALYSTALAALPLLLTIPQSMRTAAASQLSLAFARAPEDRVKTGYLLFSMAMLVLNTALAIAVIELYLAFERTYVDDHAALRLGLYCLTGHAAGFALTTIVTGPASAYRNFLPDNVAKFWPGVFHLGGIALIWRAGPAGPLSWTFLCYLASSWSIALWLFARHGGTLFGKGGIARHRDRQIERDLGAGMRGVLWWNLTAYCSTTAAAAVVALQHPAHVVAFSIATSLRGVMVAGLIAVGSPLAGYAAGLYSRDAPTTRRFYLWVNTLFQLYVVAVAVVVCLLPERLFALWLTPQVAGEVRLFCLMLMPAYVLRTLTNAYQLFVMSAGRQHRMWLTPLVEAIVAMTGMIVLGYWMGITGVVAGLTLSGLVRLAMTILHDEPRHNAALGLRRFDMVVSGFRLLRQDHRAMPIRSETMDL